MAASGYTPISLYYTTTASGVPTAVNLINGELAINITDGKLFYKDNAGVVQVIADKNVTSGSVTLTGTQTLTNKTISADNNTLSGIAASSFVLSNASGNIDGAAAQKAIPSGVVVGTTDTQTLSNKTIERAVLNDGYTEEVFAITDGASVNLDPNNGSIQTWTLGATRTPGQANWAAGQSIVLMVTAGANAITWTTLAVEWKTDGGNAPTLNAASVTAIVLWKVGTTIYGARVGDA